MALLRLLSRFGRPFSAAIVAVIVLNLVSTLAILYLPSLNARIIDEGVVTGDIGLIWRLGGVMVAVAFVQVFAAAVAIWLAARVAMGTGRAIRSAVFRRVISLPVEDVSAFGTPTLITRGTNDVQQVQMVFLVLLSFMVAAPITMIGGVTMAFREDPGLSPLIVVSVVVLTLTVGLLCAPLVNMFARFQTQVDALNGVLREQIAGIRVVRAFAREDHEAARFDVANRDITTLSLNIGKLFVLLFPALMFILNAATAAVVWFGGLRVGAGEVEVGALTAFLQYLLQILSAVMTAAFVVVMLPRALVCARRIAELLDASPSRIDAPVDTAPGSAPDNSAALELEGVSFAYPGAQEPVVAEVSISARPGEVIAVIGATGSGKSTLLSLIPRLLAPTEGRVLLGGVDAATLSRAELSKRVRMVPQKAFLFSGTVASNLRLADPEATDEQLWEALRVAQAADFVAAHELGLAMPISQGGTNVSGGQRQRLCIARALVGRASVYLFDDSFSALDMATDARLRKALRPRLAAATTVMVAQRVSTIAHADRIYVIDAGRIVAHGSHAELMASSRTYQDIVNSQITDGGQE
ncbi:ABC transporter ATP-binding protein [Corynebacterium uterequi]|uniref:ABC-type multidrug transport system, ATPase and permease component n=1 Tax=Corynebacterium uterequi TaxID=1072256 RepID=A0A0G3HJ45_9CORY|nr:ABC transporter ATP-binding protein [Corynebacterium uterequi]AKK11978.1 ABC-type multidrug transport system, ATPase and permease component [Corynebacterium uterequi]